MRVLMLPHPDKISGNRADGISQVVTWYCQNCGRIEAPKDQRYCGNCNNKMQRSSHYEWFLFDEMKRLLEIICDDRKFKITQQLPIKDHRGFYWYWDIYTWVEGKSHFGGYHELIDIQGKDHNHQKKYSGAGGGYTRDYDKHWEIFNTLRLHKQGWDVRYVTNDDCKRNVVYITAIEIVDELLLRADTFC